MIKYDSDLAAKKVTVTGWVDRHGHFHGDDEHSARYCGCTHLKCDNCDEMVEKGYWALCKKCKEQADIKRYLKKPEKDVGEDSIVFSEQSGLYFVDLDTLREVIVEEKYDIDEMRLVICDPIAYSQLDSSFYEDELPEDADVSKEIQDAIDALNEVVSKEVSAYEPGKFRVKSDTIFRIKI